MKLKNTFYISIFFVLLALISVIGVTFAWFTLSGADASITPITGSVTPGEMDLSISSTVDGTFGINADITRKDKCEFLMPVSTSNLINFYTSKAQNNDGKIILYKDISNDYLDKIIYGEFFLQAKYTDGVLYFDTDNLSITGSSQLISASRMGMVIDDGVTKKQYIFDLQNHATAGAVQQNTIETSLGSVVNFVDKNGKASFVKEDTKLTSAFSAHLLADESIDVGNSTPLYTLTKDKIAKVEIWIYMEGCDEHCILKAQKQDININLAFVADSVIN